MDSALTARAKRHALHSDAESCATQQRRPLSDPLRQLLHQHQQTLGAQNNDTIISGAKNNGVEKLASSITLCCTADLESRQVLDAAAVIARFQGYETILPGRNLADVGRVSAVASGICGGVHATASALCLEMMLGMRPPPLGIQLRNLLLSCQYLNDNTLHLFLLAGPDYSARIVATTNPELWRKAQKTPARLAHRHGFARVSEIMSALDKPDGALYQQGLAMVRLARSAYATLGGRYPHSESIVPGGAELNISQQSLHTFVEQLQPFTAFAAKTVALWDDLCDFFLEANPAYAQVGRAPTNLLDFGQWDHHQHYDASYRHCDTWGEHRWSTPGAIINGQLITSRLSELNCGLEEFIDHSFYRSTQDSVYREDPLGNPLSPHHPWNKRVLPTPQADTDNDVYSWGTAMTWRGHSFEVGAYARVYLSALAQKIPSSDFVATTGRSLQIQLHDHQVEWTPPAAWNALERNRARAYALAFNQMITLDNVEITRTLIKSGAASARAPMAALPSGTQLGMGLWGAGRGFLAHWASLKDGVIDNYQVMIPSRINAAPRAPDNTPGPIEQAVLNTPILETGFSCEEEFQAIDIQRCIQSFDPCMSAQAIISLAGSGRLLEREVDTRFPGT